MTETDPVPEADTDNQDTYFKVFENVISALTILLCLIMFIFGCVTVDTCQTNPELPITILIQGILSIGMPISFLLKYGIQVTSTKIPSIAFYTEFIVCLFISICCLIACTHFLRVCGCKEKDVYKGGIFFVVMLWIVAVVTGLAWLLKLNLSSQTASIGVY